MFCKCIVLTWENVITCFKNCYLWTIVSNIFVTEVAHYKKYFVTVVFRRIFHCFSIFSQNIELSCNFSCLYKIILRPPLLLQYQTHYSTMPAQWVSSCGEGILNPYDDRALALFKCNYRQLGSLRDLPLLLLSRLVFWNFGWQEECVFVVFFLWKN